MTELETKTETEDFTDELSDEALDREDGGDRLTFLSAHDCLGIF